MNEQKVEHEKRCHEFKSEIDSFKKNDSERFAFYEEKTKTLEGQLSKLNDEKTEILEGLKVQKDNFKKFIIVLSSISISIIKKLCFSI